MLTEEVVNIAIPSGQSSGKVEITPQRGNIIRAVIYTGQKNNNGIINAGIFDDNGTELSPMQCIDNYRSRESGYLDCKPFFNSGGRKLRLNIEATQNFSAGFVAQLILIYDVSDRKGQRDSDNFNC